MAKRHYADFFTVPVDYRPNMTREAINETPETWLDFYPHTKFVEFLNKLFSNYVLNGGSKSLWLTGNYGTGKSNAALVTEKLFMDDETRVRKWFDDYKDKISDPESLLKRLFALRNEGTLVIYDYDASGVGPNEDFLVRLERGIIAALDERGMAIPAKANLDAVIERVRREDKHFFELRDAMQDELAYLNAGIHTAEQLIMELQKVHQHTDAPSDLLGDVQKVLHRDNIYLDISVDTFRKWIKDILALNSIKRIVYIFDEFSEFIESNKEHLKFFEDITENPGINKFYLIPVTHLTINAYWAEGAPSAKKANDRFYFSNLQMPNDTAFKLAAHAMKPNPDPIIVEEWKTEKQNLWEAVRGITDYFTADESSADYVSKQSFFEILPIHPMAAFLLKFLAESARSNQRSIFEYLKGSADGNEFQDFIRTGGPAIASKQFLTADYLWKYFIEREDLGLSKEIIAIRSEFSRIRSNNDFCNKDDDDEDIRVLKTVLLFCLLSRLLTTEAHDRLKPTVDNIKLAFQGDGSIVNIDGIIKNLAEKHCFSVVNGNIELFASSVANADLQKKIDEYRPKFHELLSAKTEDAIKAHKKSDIAKFSAGRFDVRVSDILHTTMTNITSTVRDRYSNGLAKDTGTVCLWFVVAKNKEEQLQVAEKIRSILINLKDHRIIMFAFPSLTFCDNNLGLWDDYVEQYAKYMLENDFTAKDQCKKAYERIEREWFDRVKAINTPLKYYIFINEQVVANDASWSKFKDIINIYVKKTLPACVDCLTEQTTAFGNNGLKSWALAGLVPENASSSYKQLVSAFKNQGISGDDAWFATNPKHPIAQIRALFDKKIANTIGKGTSLSIRKVYIELQRAPYGMKYNALSAFVLGIALRSILTKGYQWDNKQKTGALDAQVLSEIIESVVKDDGQDHIKSEKEICRLSPEEKAFVEKAPRMFGITNAVVDARVEDVLGLIQTQVEEISGRAPLWVLPEYIHSVEDPLADDIAVMLSSICLAFTISSKGKTEDRTNAIKEVGKLIRSNTDLVSAVAKYTTNAEDFFKAFEMYVDRNATKLVALASDIGDISHAYCDAIKAKAVETAGWLWKENDISAEIEATEQEYEIIKCIKAIANINSYITYKQAFNILYEAIVNKNKLPKALITTAIPSLSVFLSAVASTGTTNDIRDGLVSNSDTIKALFFDMTKAKTMELLKQRLNGIVIGNTDLLEIYNDLTSEFLQDENVFLNDVRAKIKDFAKRSVALKVKENWSQLTGTESPSAWAIANGLPARLALGDAPDATDLLVAIEFPEKFSADKLDELLNIISGLSPVGITDCQAKFIAETVPRRFAKFNISLSSLLEFLNEEYGKQPNSWPLKPDINSFIRRQYKGTFAPQVTEKINKTAAEDLKKRLLQLAQENPELGLLFWEE